MGTGRFSVSSFKPKLFHERLLQRDGTVGVGGFSGVAVAGLLVQEAKRAEAEGEVPAAFQTGVVPDSLWT
jgi:hypothetical protein